MGLYRIKIKKMKINPAILAAFNTEQNGAEEFGLNPNGRSFCEGNIMNSFLRFCDIPGSPGTDSQWCIDELQKTLYDECGKNYSCLITENGSASAVSSIHDYRGQSDNYYAICGEVKNDEINSSKLQSACRAAYGACWSNQEETSDCMRNALYGYEDNAFYQYCPGGNSNILIAQQDKSVKIANGNPDGNTGRDSSNLPYQCLAYCTSDITARTRMDDNEN